MKKKISIGEVIEKSMHRFKGSDALLMVLKMENGKYITLLISVADFVEFAVYFHANVGENLYLEVKSSTEKKGLYDITLFNEKGYKSKNKSRSIGFFDYHFKWVKKHFIDD